VQLAPVRVLAATAALLLVSAAFAASAGVPDGPADAPSASTFERDGFTYVHRAVETHDASAQFDFDRGLTLLYAFDPAAARKAFESAAHRDPSLAMAQWGIALSHGPNINTDFDSDEQRRGRAAVERARSLEGGATPVDRALIDAAATRYASDRSKDADAVAQAYRDAMQTVADRFSADDDVQVLAAEAALDVHPWEYFNDDGTPKPWTPSIIARLQTVLARDPNHLGANHYIIHADEESGDPEAAGAAARALFAHRFEPAAEHLDHMPAHALMRLGAYHDAGVANERAVDDFLHYRANDDGTESDHDGYFGHDCDFGVQAFAMAGERARAAALAKRCATPRYAALVDARFGRYVDVQNDDPAWPGAAAARAFAEGDYDAALRLATALPHASAPAAIARDVILARVASARGDHARAIGLLTRAVKDEDGLGYSEPPRFYYPVRETLGAELERSGDDAKAEAVFRADLEKNRENPRSLFGLATTLEHEGKSAEAAGVRARFERAWANADATLTMESL
jgi:Tfp pilus assembly protein PilF